MERYTKETGWSRCKKKTSSTSYTTSSDVRVELDLNENDKLELEEIVRSMGRDKTKNTENNNNASGFSETEEIQKMIISVEQYNFNFTERLTLKKEKLATKRKGMRGKAEGVWRKTTPKRYEILMQKLARGNTKNDSISSLVMYIVCLISMILEEMKQLAILLLSSWNYKTNILQFVSKIRKRSSLLSSRK